ncbi:MAG: hypothetical protein E6G42_01590 [Actinobacteria bacterium]|nr:MAG: hypothetical protein E6G42_01590 [Actinomycetota bacterium]
MEEKGSLFRPVVSETRRTAMYPSSHFHQEIARERYAELLREATAARRVKVATDELGPRSKRRLLRLASGWNGRRAAARASLEPAG